MFIDATLFLADGQASTVDAASTSYIDTLAAGDAYVGDWFVCRVATAPTAGAGTPTMTFELQTSNDSSFIDTTTATLSASSALVAGSLLASTIVYRTRIPLGVKRYIRGYLNTNANADTTKFTGGTYDMFIAKDVDVLVDHTQ